MHEICVFRFFFLQKITPMNVSTKQSYLAIQSQPWHVVKMITILQRRMTHTQNTVNKQFCAYTFCHRRKSVRFPNLFIAVRTACVRETAHIYIGIFLHFFLLLFGSSAMSCWVRTEMVIWLICSEFYLRNRGSIPACT